MNWIYTNGTYESFLMNNVADLFIATLLLALLSSHSCPSILTSSIYSVELDTLVFHLFFPHPLLISLWSYTYHNHYKQVEGPSAGRWSTSGDEAQV